MAAIVTNNFRMRAAEQFVDDLTDAQVQGTKYYLGIARPQVWPTNDDPETPYDNTHVWDTDVWKGMMALKEINSATDYSYAAYRHQWISGTTYAEYDDRDAELEGKNYFVLTESYRVYLCVKAGPGPSTSNPDAIGVQTSGVTTTGDGYTWKFLFQVPTGAVSKFLTSAFIPVTRLETIGDAGSDNALLDQWSVQTNAIDGGIYNVKIVSGGSYAGTPTVVFDGDGDGNLAGTVQMTGDTVTGITVTNPGSGYTKVVVSFSGGTPTTNAVARAVIPPRGGYGFRPENDLRAHFVGLNVQLIYSDGGGDFPTQNDFRQIAIIRNPYNLGTTTVATATTLTATKYLTMTADYAFSADDVVFQAATGAKGIVVEYDSINFIVRYIQDDSTGYTPFVHTQPIKEVSDAGGGQALEGDGVFDVIPGASTGVEPNSGEVIFIENRSALSRASDQIETIKLVLEF